MMNITIKNMILLISGMLLLMNLQGQVGIQFFDDAATDVGNSVAETTDKGFIIGGVSFSDSTEVTSIRKIDSYGNEIWKNIITTRGVYVKVIPNLNGNFTVMNLDFIENTKVLEVDNLGNILWEQNFPFLAFDLAQDIDGNYALLYQEAIEPNNYEINVFITKFNENDNNIWTNNYSIGDTNRPSNFISTPNGGFIVSGRVDYLPVEDDAFIFKIDSNGNQEWVISEIEPLDNIYQIVRNQYGDYIAIGEKNTQESSIFTIKFNDEGELLSTFEYSSPDGLYKDGRLLTIDENDNLFLGGLHIDNVTNDASPLILKTDSEGNLLWSKKINLTLIDDIDDIEAISNNEIVLFGAGLPVFANADMMLVKLDSLGDIKANHLKGNAYLDFDVNCEQNIDETGRKNWIVEAQGPTNFSTTTDSLGNYSMLLDSGDYQIKIYLPNDYWQSCEEEYYLNFTEFLDTLNLNLPIQPIVNCPRMQVNISNNFLRPCPLPNKIIVQYCNEGTTTAEAALLEVTLHEDMAVDSISADPAAVAGDLYTFALGDLAPFDCGQITFHFQLECDSVQLGQTLCAEAHIYPDTLCLDPVWTGPIISVDGQCHPDSITFIIENEGDDMPDPQQYIIIEDNIILLQEPYQLLNGETEEITIPKEDNATYFMLAEQSPDLPPVLGNNYATFAIENCEVLPLTGIFNQFPLDDAEPYFDELCRVVTGSYDPNDKQGFPTGFGDDHRIEQNVDLDYLIRFQNTGTDTAFTVVIRDNLSEFLDLTTLRPGASSHDYDLEIVNGRTLKFTFDNILLPDSTTNEPLSHGWVEFHIAQVVDNPVGTLINNRADIYFDGNAPILTNTTEHLVWIDFIDILDETTQVFQEDVELKVYPNPAQEYAIFEIKNLDNADLTFKLFNSAGQLQRVDDFEENAYYFYRNGLTEGLYFYQIESEGKLVVTGKLVLR